MFYIRTCKRGSVKKTTKQICRTHIKPTATYDIFLTVNTKNQQKVLKVQKKYVLLSLYSWDGLFIEGKYTPESFGFPVWISERKKETDIPFCIVFICRCSFFGNQTSLGREIRIWQSQLVEPTYKKCISHNKTDITTFFLTNLPDNGGRKS